MTTVHQPATPSKTKRVVKVGPDLIAAAQLRELLDEQLGRTTSPVIAKVARARRGRPQA